MNGDNPAPNRPLVA
ncbi:MULTISPECIES: hypothetical protein [Citrobacter]